MNLHGMVNMTNEEYHSTAGISKSMLDAIAPEQRGTPLNYWDKYINPEREPQEFKHCFAVGDGTHKLVLEPNTFELTYAVDFDKSAFPKALDTIADMKAELSKQNYPVSGTRRELAERLYNELEYPRSQIMWFLEQDHLASMEGKIAISATDYKNMMNSLRAVWRDPASAYLLKDAFVEQSFFVTKREIILDPRTGDILHVEDVLRKCRTDIITSNGRIVADLKTTDDVSLAGFGKTIAQRRYHVQAAWYLDVLAELYGNDAPKEFVFIAAQKTRPYDVAVHVLTAEQIQLGRQLYKRDLHQILMCQKENKWLGATNGVPVTAQLPDWEMRKLNQELF